MSGGHSVRCADAVSTAPNECGCRCGGDLHGGPHTERVRALVWEENDRERYSQGQVTAAKRKAVEAVEAKESVGEKCTDFAVTHMVDVFIGATSAADQKVARDTLKSVLDPFVEEIATADLGEADEKNVKTAVNNLHIICSFCVEILKVIDQAEKLVGDMADGLADVVVDAVSDYTFLTKIAKEVLRRALSRSFLSVIDLLADPARVEMLRIVGFATCPDVTDHWEVKKYCVSPLGGGYVTDALDSWIDNDFPSDSDILKRRHRRGSAG